MRRFSFTARRTREASRRVALRASGAALALTFAVSLGLTTGAAQAVVVSDQNVAGPNNAYGVALVAGTALPAAASGISPVAPAAPCTDPALSADLVLPTSGLCSHGGAVMHGNETFTLTWDPDRRYWSTTRNYVQQFLRDVASGSGSFSSPYADTTQYTDTTGRAANASVFGGGCVDLGATGGWTCTFGDTNGSGTGNDYPQQGQAGDCPEPSGTNQWYEYPGGVYNPAGGHPNDVCLTDTQLKAELQAMIPATNMLSHVKSGDTPLVVVLTPPGVVDCLDSNGALCSFNGASSSQFCSYHGQVNVGGTQVAYVVQPWTASWSEPANFSPPVCDDPSIQSIQPNETVTQLATDVGKRLVSPLSQAQLAAITNPGVTDGWFNNLYGTEINDNGCIPFDHDLDLETVGSGSYYLQREFNNGGAIVTDPNALLCTPNVLLSSSFVAPSPVNPTDEVQFDGATTVSSLIVPKGNYQWNFGDGETAIGPSVVHVYTAPGLYTVTLSVTDRGGNQSTSRQTIVVGTSGPGGSVTPPTSQPGHGASSSLQVHLQLSPQSLKSVLRSGLALRVSSNRPANGILTISISRAAAKRAHIKVGKGSSVVIARGTTAGIRNGVVSLRLGLPRATAAKLKRLGHVSFTIQLKLVAPGGAHVAVDAAGRY